MSNPADIDDIVSRWRPLTDAEATVAGTRLDDAWRKLKKDVPGLESRMTGDDDLTADVIRVLSDSVIRVLRSLAGDGMRRRTVSVDDASTTWESDDANRATLYFTDEELGDLSSTGKRKRARGYSVMPS